MTAANSHAQVLAADAHEPKAHAASHQNGGSDEIDVTGLTGAGSPTEILDIPTAETDNTLVLAPDGAGGVEFRAEAGGSGGGFALPLDAAAIEAVGSGDLFPGTSLDGGWSSLQSTAVTNVNRSIAGAVILENTGNTSGAERGIKRTFTPAGDFTVWCRLERFYPLSANFQWSGIFVGAIDPSDGASGHRIECFLLNNSGIQVKFAKQDAGAETSIFNTVIQSLPAEAVNPQGTVMKYPVWLGISRVSTTVTALISWDGVKLYAAGSTTTISFTVNTVGLFIAESTATANLRGAYTYIATAG